MSFPDYLDTALPLLVTATVCKSELSPWYAMWSDPLVYSSAYFIITLTLSLDTIWTHPPSMRFLSPCFGILFPITEPTNQSCTRHYAIFSVKRGIQSWVRYSPCEVIVHNLFARLCLKCNTVFAPTSTSAHPKQPKQGVQLQSMLAKSPPVYLQIILYT